MHVARQPPCARGINRKLPLAVERNPSLTAELRTWVRTTARIDEVRADRRETHRERLSLQNARSARRSRAVAPNRNWVRSNGRGRDGSGPARAAAALAR